jgi:non-specific serine/threonine protein kinase
MIQPRTKFGVGVANGLIYALGGCKEMTARPGTMLDSVECYDPANNTWSLKQSMPVKRVGLAVATVGHYIYALGGIAAIGAEFVGPSNSVDVYDTLDDTWKEGVP